MLQNTNKLGRRRNKTPEMEGLGSERKPYKVEKGTESQRRKSLTDEGLKMPRKSRTKRKEKVALQVRANDRGCDINK